MHALPAPPNINAGHARGHAAPPGTPAAAPPGPPVISRHASSNSSFFIFTQSINMAAEDACRSVLLIPQNIYLAGCPEAASGNPTDCTGAKRQRCFGPETWSAAQTRGQVIRYYKNRIIVAVCDLERLRVIAESMAGSYQSPLLRQHFATAKQDAIHPLSWFSAKMLSLPPWSETTHGNFDENDVLAALVLAIFRRDAAGHFAKIYWLDFLALFKQISAETMVTEETAGTRVLAEAMGLLD